MIRIFPDFSVQVTASAAGGPGGGGGGGMVTGPQLGRLPVPGATNGTPQGVQGLGGYQQRYVELRGKRPVACVWGGGFSVFLLLKSDFALFVFIFSTLTLIPGSC